MPGFFSGRKWGAWGTVSQKQLLFFTKNLSILLKAGSTLPESLLVLKDQAKGKLRYILTESHVAINKGQKFSDALRKFPHIFSELYTNVIEIGEETGKLDTNLDHLALQLEKNYTLKKKITNAMIYPAIVLVSGVAISMSIVIFIMPNITKLFKNFKIELPITTRILLAVSEFLQANGVVALAIFVGGIVIFAVLIRRPFIRPITHWIILHTPIVKPISMHLNTALFCRTLSSLLESGITIDEGLRICAKSSPNYYYKAFLTEAHGRIKAGDTLSSLLQQKKHLFGGTDTQIIGVGEASGTLVNSLTYCSVIHEDEIDNLTKNLAAILEPILLITIGLMVGFVALSILTPIFSITGQFNRR